MIFLNGTEINQNHFTDGALDIKVDINLLRSNTINTIEWLFDSNEELVTVYFLTKHLQSKGVDRIELKMPYIPNARRDRVRDDNNVFTLKYFADMINSLHFTRVEVLDPHSTVSEALIDRVCCVGPEANIISVLEKVGKRAVLFYPDEGAVKRYAGEFDRPYVFGMKSRNPETRKVDKLYIEGNINLIRDEDVLMVDDICGSGSTLLRAAKELKKYGADKLYVYVSHCETTVLQNTELLNIVAGIYTTNSILRASHPKIHIIDETPRNIEDNYIPPHQVGFFGEIASTEEDQDVDIQKLSEELRMVFKDKDDV